MSTPQVVVAEAQDVNQLALLTSTEELGMCERGHMMTRGRFRRTATAGNHIQSLKALN